MRISLCDTNGCESPRFSCDKKNGNDSLEQPWFTVVVVGNEPVHPRRYKDFRRPVEILAQDNLLLGTDIAQRCCLLSSRSYCNNTLSSISKK